MPLLRTLGDAELDEARSMLGFWMRDPKVAIGPVEAVRVFVSLDALWQMSSSAARDVYSAVEIFDVQRGRIELAASRRYDNPTGRPEEGERHGGKPIVVITSDDLASIPRESRPNDPSRLRSGC